MNAIDSDSNSNNSSNDNDDGRNNDNANSENYIIMMIVMIINQHYKYSSDKYGSYSNDCDVNNYNGDHDETIITI